MQARFLQLLHRLEALSLRERMMTLVGVPLVLLVAGEWLVFGPARNQAVEARKQADRLEGDVKALDAALALQPAAAPLPRADQLLKQRTEKRQQINAAEAILASVNESVDWGTVVRATVAGTRGLTLTQLKTLPAEMVFSPSMIKPAKAAAPARGAPTANAPASATGLATAPPLPGIVKSAGGENIIYRHRAELTVTGNFDTLTGYLQTLQRLPGDLHWNSLQLDVAGYPQASVRLSLYTLSNRAETPFN